MSILIMVVKRTAYLFSFNGLNGREAFEETLSRVADDVYELPGRPFIAPAESRGRFYRGILPGDSSDQRLIAKIQKAVSGYGADVHACPLVIWY